VKKAPRIILGAGAGLAIVVAAALALCLESVDYRPYFRDGYYQQTTARLRAQAATNGVARGELSAGFGRALLTPTINAAQDDPATGKFRSITLAGYGDRKGRPATGVHDDVFIKAVALRVGDKVGVMLGADALIIPREVADLAAQRIETELKLSREQIYLSATHTHSSLGGWGEGYVGEAFSGKFQPGARVWFADRIVTAVREALSDLKPASFGSGHFTAPKFIRNRLVGDLGKSDPEFSFLLFRQKEGRSAVLGSFSAHSTVLSGRNMEFSADYPGYWQRAVETATGGMAVFLAGGVGSQSPSPGEGGFKGAELMGEALAKLLLEKLPATPLTNYVVFDLLGLEVSMPELHARVSDGLRLRPWLAARLLRVKPGTYLQEFRINDALWVSTPCDFSAELALEIKQNLRQHGLEAVVTSFNGDYIGYVIPHRYYHLGGYEPRLMSFYGPNVPDYLEDLIGTMALQITR
jgi:neutral ceramidase